MKLTPREKLHSLSTESKSGFTIVELMFAMTFVATLLIAIAIVTINIVSIYQKGLALKAVSSVGRSLIEELTTTINEAPAIDTTSLCNHLASNTGGSTIGYTSVEACLNDRANLYVYGDRADGGKQDSGVFCTGNYSYLWNTRYGLKNTKRTLSLNYMTQGGADANLPDGSAEPPRILRIKDTTHRVCTAFLQAKNDPLRYPPNGDWRLDIKNEVKNGASNPIPTPTDGYLSAFDLDLFFYEFTVQPISQDAITLRTFMSGNFILATDRGGIDITVSGDYCKNQFRDENGDLVDATHSLGDIGAEFNYCAINKFNFAARTAGV